MQESTETNRRTLELTTRDNQGWDKGWFSKFRFLMSKLRLARKEEEDETERLSSGYRI